MGDLIVIAAVLIPLAISLLWIRYLSISLWRLVLLPGRIAREKAREAAYPSRAYWRTWWREAFPRGLLVGVLLSPVLFCVLFMPKKIVAAKYAAEPIPVIGNLQTLIGLYTYECECLPGLPHNADGSLDLALTDVTNHPGGVSILVSGATPLQSFVGSVQEDGSIRYEPSVYTTLGSATNILLQVDATPSQVSLTNHFAGHLDLLPLSRHLTGNRIKPKHFQYRVMSGGYQTSSYAYVIGAFGDGDGLKAGTGYARIQVVNSKVEVNYSGTWERYKPMAKRPNQIVMVNAEEAREFFKCESPAQAREMNICWVGDTDALMSGDRARVEKALKELEQAGWEF